MSPLGLRNGVDPTKLSFTSEELGERVADVLLDRFGYLGTLEMQRSWLAAEFASRSVIDSHGNSLTPDTVVTPGLTIWLYRQLPVEATVPFDMPIIYQDEKIVVVDKPHFLATMPRGSRVVETALVRLRRQLDSDTVAPAHRLDRLTAGVLLFTVDPAVRGAYQQMFASRSAHKEYRALAAVPPASQRFPVTVRSRIEKTPGIMRAFEVDGPVNAESEINYVGPTADGAVGQYHLIPHTGKTHQLRVHMNSLRLPIVGDPLYPVESYPADDVFDDPLQLLAFKLSFTDPVDGVWREFVSRRALAR